MQSVHALCGESAASATVAECTAARQSLPPPVPRLCAPSQAAKIGSDPKTAGELTFTKLPESVCKCP